MQNHWTYVRFYWEQWNIKWAHSILILNWPVDINLREFVLTTVILAPGACRTQALTCFGWMRFRWIGWIRWIRWIGWIRCRIPGGLILCACAWLQQLLLGIQGPFPLKSKNSLGGSPGRGLGNFWDCLEAWGLQNIYPLTPDQPHLAAVMLYNICMYTYIYIYIY